MKPELLEKYYDVINAIRFEEWQTAKQISKAANVGLAQTRKFIKKLDDAGELDQRKRSGELEYRYENGID